MGPFAGALGTQASAAVKASIIAGIGSPTTFDLGAMLQTLGMPTAAASRVELAGDTVCVRFDPSGPAIGRLLADHDWGVFIDGTAVERLAEHKIPQDLSSAITSMRMTHQWRPAGGTPHVDIDFEGAAQVPDPFSGRVSGRFACDLSVIPIPRGPAAGLSFAGGRFAYASAGASSDGMTIGGLVRLLEEPSRATVQTSMTPFADPRFVVYASHHGCVFGWAGEMPSSDEMRVSAAVGLEMSGEFCGIEVVSPADWIGRYVVHDPTSHESRTVRISLPALAALGITEPVRILVHTSRGTRLLDLGKPRVEVDEDGTIVNAAGSYIDDCLYATPWVWYWTTLPVDPVTGEPLPPPQDPWPPPDWNMSNPDWLISPPDIARWNDYLDSLNALNVQLSP